MKAKRLLPVFVCVILAVVGSAIALSKSRQRPISMTPEQIEEGRLKNATRRAKAEGKRSIVIPASITTPAAVGSMEEALSKYTAVVAKPVESKSFIFDKDRILTWYKFKIIENLSSQKPFPPCDICPAPPDAPADMLPLEEDEFVLLKNGGTAVVDDVLVTSSEGGFPPFAMTRQYLLFIELNPATRVGRLWLKDYGVFTLDSEGRIKHINNKNHPFKHELELPEGTTGNALEHLKEKIKRHSK